MVYNPLEILQNVLCVHFLGVGSRDKEKEDQTFNRVYDIQKVKN